MCVRRGREGVASVHAACVQVDDTPRPPFPIFRVVSPCPLRGKGGWGCGFLMVFHLNTVDLVPVAAPVTSLFLCLTPSLSFTALCHHT